MQPTVTTILSRIYGHGRGWVFTPKSFIDLADPRTVGVHLGRLVSRGTIVRLARGLYVYPEVHKQLGVLMPSMEEIARAIAGKSRIRLLPSGAYAANRLGLSEQVPARVVFLTDGESKRVVLGKSTLELKKTSPRLMSLAEKESGLIIQALRYLGREHIDSQVVRRLKRSLPPKATRELMRNLALAPAWLRPVLIEIAGEDSA